MGDRKKDTTGKFREPWYEWFAAKRAGDSAGCAAVEKEIFGAGYSVDSASFFLGVLGDIVEEGSEEVVRPSEDDLGGFAEMDSTGAVAYNLLVHGFASKPVTVRFVEKMKRELAGKDRWGLMLDAAFSGSKSLSPADAEWLVEACLRKEDSLAVCEDFLLNLKSTPHTRGWEKNFSLVVKSVTEQSDEKHAESVLTDAYFRSPLVFGSSSENPFLSPTVLREALRCRLFLENQGVALVSGEIRSSTELSMFGEKLTRSFPGDTKSCPPSSAKTVFTSTLDILIGMSAQKTEEFLDQCLSASSGCSSSENPFSLFVLGVLAEFFNEKYDSQVSIKKTLTDKILSIDREFKAWNEYAKKLPPESPEEMKRFLEAVVFVSGRCKHYTVQKYTNPEVRTFFTALTNMLSTNPETVDIFAAFAERPGRALFESDEFDIPERETCLAVAATVSENNDEVVL